MTMRSRSRNPTSIQDEFVDVDWKPATSDNLSYLDIGDKLEILPVLPHILRDEVLNSNRNRISKEKRQMMSSFFIDREDGKQFWLWWTIEIIHPRFFFIPSYILSKYFPDYSFSNFHFSLCLVYNLYVYTFHCHFWSNWSKIQLNWTINYFA